MKVPMRWLAEFVETGLTPQQLAAKLTMAGLEAEKVEEIGGEWDKVYVGVVEQVERHPNADRLVLAEVDAGEHHLTVVTGAPNIQKGQKVALALAGARLIDGHSETRQIKTLKPGMIRGVRSEGMVCSEKELGLSDEHEGILVLEPEAPVGVPLADWLGETVIEFEITPNLAHDFSILGIAREAAAIANRPLRVPPVADLAARPQASDLVRVEVSDLCPRYVGVVIEGVAVGPSPTWMARRLTAAGLRPINNVVDVTNYVMLEWGQPLHAFDRNHLAEGRIVVRRAQPGETIETLDHQQRQLAPDMLVIADAARPVAVAGVMGGVNSEVDGSTSTILLESANFEMRSVRQTARSLKLRTDASARFERGLDPELAWPAAARAAQLLLDLCPEARVSAVQDVYPQPVTARPLSLPFGLIERVLGVSYPPETVLDVLGRLGFSPSLAGEGPSATLSVIVPTYRRDVSLPEDIVEEVARIVGYDTLPETLPVGAVAPVVRDPIYRLQQEARRVLVGAGCFETVSYVTIGEDQLMALGAEPARAGFLHLAPLETLVRLVNPIQAERPLLRPTLIPSLLDILSANLKHEVGVRLFELSRVYLPRGGDELPHEASTVGIVMAGQREATGLYAAPGHVQLDFFDLKGTVDELLDRLGVPARTYSPVTEPALHPGRTTEICAGPTRLGLLGELRPDVAASFSIEGPRVVVAELDLDAILQAREAAPAQLTVPRFLPVEQDFAIVVPEATPAADVLAALRAGAGPLATNVALFDIYRGSQIGEGKKSLAYRVTFTAPDRALTDAELAKVRGRIEKTLAQRVNGILRS